MQRALILDVDGVFTDGTKIYDNSGYAVMKRFCDHDFTAVKKFQADGWLVVMMSADPVVNRNLASNRDIHFWDSRAKDGTIDKGAEILKLLGHYWPTTVFNVPGQTNPMVVYVGDDLFDIPPMQYVLSIEGRAYCPANAAPQVKDFLADCGGVLLTRGGEGAIMELYTIYGKDSQPPTH